MSRRSVIALGAGIAVLAAAGLVLAGFALVPARPRWVVPGDDPREIAAGAVLYQSNCASCHGAHLEGQPDWHEPGPDGLLPAPPHDATGHTWQHSDAELTELVTHSVASFAPAGYRTTMPAFEGKLSPAEIHATIAYIKSTWAPGIRAYQAAQNPGGPSLAELPGDWQFPPTCGYHFPTKVPAADRKS
ncbi:MAG TPA: cytochrome c [Aliidongia sp.]|uniref:c-type cytochrome n=1 Tax=Aliidongia sp. TaxID=1914230 RepID=UPI002DDC9351|nr:cytochrome c [Aliidongia sp.]HEV2673492.1 cytochrome c [Aliidongia sp.]